jgi:hypothetical protein
MVRYGKSPDRIASAGLSFREKKEFHKSPRLPPLEYLERWLNANRLLGDNAKLRGVSETDEGVQVVISHPFIEGPYPQKPDIIDELRRRGFNRVPQFFIGSESDSSFYHEEKRIGIFDATCDNFILSQGVPIPVDVVIVAVGETLRRQLLNLIRP